ncbi:translocation/assembly module TamB domain-containing protein [Rhodobacter ferrooxidans]|uniref:Translocation and assembly module TamB C-terminal domain-containing protein n=1 Tax=Rhodobacter ferrooxidans TaxID=371731 RepID=C8S236_9RHOB|nr:translocation/assembly module TamB domain-containing protein [Rhodobacter sp. SW2]EEW24908.1 protein of unknown function DUF490 [Rhodobacter sp. SW2]
MRRLAILALVVLPHTAAAQTDDRSYLTAFLEDNFSDIGRTVTISGFQGALSSRATMTQMTIADSEGIWLTLNDVALEWNRAALLKGRVSVNALTAAEIIVARAPVAETDGLSAEAQGFSLPDLPVSVEIGRIAATRIELAPEVLGQAVEGSLEASMSLIAGEGEANLRLERSDDGPQGLVTLTASYGNASGILALNLQAKEGAGGVAATLLGLPGVPSAELTIKGTGPVSDYAADVRLVTDEVERLAGGVTLTANDIGGHGFNADLTGDLAPLFLPQYADFLGTSVQLQADGQRDAGGRLDLRNLSLRGGSVALQGALVLAADGLPERFDLTGSLRQADGTPVLLPFGADQPTSVQAADLALRFDAAKGDDWQGSAVLTGLRRADFAAESLKLDGTGQITRQAGNAIAADFRFDAKGLAPRDPGLAQALGEALTGTARLNWREGAGVVTVSDLTLQGADFGVQASGSINGLASGFALKGRAQARLDDLSRASGLAGRALSGSGVATVTGSGSLLSGGFDLQAEITGTDLRFGQAELDNLLRGQSRIELSALRDETGTQVRRLEIAARSLTAVLAGRVATAGSDLTADLDFTDLSVLGGGYRGALTGKAHLTGTPQTGAVTLEAVATGLAVGHAEADSLLRGKTDLSLAFDLRDGKVTVNRASLRNPQLSAEASGSQSKVDLTALLANLGLLLPEFPGSVTVSGTVEPDAAGSVLNLKANGPGQIAATVSGRLGSGFDTADLKISGTGQAGLANVFLGSRVVSGPLQFDLALRGPFKLASLSGKLSLSGGRLTDPDLPFALQAVMASADLAGGRAQVAAQAAVSSGGRIEVQGGIGLTAPFPGDLAVQVQNAVLKDPALYQTRANGTLTIRGPLNGGAVIAGTLRLAETELQIPSTGMGSLGSLPDLRHVNEPADVRATRVRAGLLGAGGAAVVQRRAYPLDLLISAPNRVFIRGRGLDAELGGELRLGGTTANVQPNGAFNLIRGRLDILGKRLDLSEASLRLEGEFVPFVRILASNESDGITSSVLIEGKATEPAVTFVSNPELPQEEVLARLLFGRSLLALSPLQAAQLANAVATLAGKGGEGLVGKLRQGFGLDDLDLVTDDQGGAAVKAGKYLGKNLYTEIVVGQQGQSQINLNLDVTPNITLRGSSDGSGNTSLGVFLEKDY